MTTLAIDKPADLRLFRIQRSVVRFVAERGAASESEVPNHHVLFRHDDKSPLAVVGDKFRVVQPATMYAFFEQVAKELDTQLYAANFTHGGRGMWATAYVGGETDIARGDTVRSQLRFHTMNDGTARTTITYETLRMWCLNQLPGFDYANDAHREAGELFRKLNRNEDDYRIAISHRSLFDPVAVAKSVAAKFNIGTEPSIIAGLRELVQTPMSPTAAREFLQRLIAPKATSPEDIAEAEATKGYQKILALFNGEGRGANAPGVKGTAWGMLNAVTEMVDHHARAKTADHRLDNAMFGKGETVKGDALTQLLARAHAAAVV